MFSNSCLLPDLHQLIIVPSVTAHRRPLSAPQSVQVGLDQATHQQGVLRVALNRVPVSEDLEMTEMALKGGDQVVAIPSNLELQSVPGVLPPHKTGFVPKGKHVKGIHVVWLVAIPAPDPTTGIETFSSGFTEVTAKQTSSPPTDITTDNTRAYPVPKG
jgi:hypothetical protein